MYSTEELSEKQEEQRGEGKCSGTTALKYATWDFQLRLFRGGHTQ
jgi:hypothetical protein